MPECAMLAVTMPSSNRDMNVATYAPFVKWNALSVNRTSAARWHGTTRARAGALTTAIRAHGSRTDATDQPTQAFTDTTQSVTTRCTRLDFPSDPRRPVHPQQRADVQSH